MSSAPIDSATSIPPSEPTPSPLALVRRHRGAGAHRPWLFWPHGWDWRWWSWEAAGCRLGDLVRLLAPALAGLEAAPGAARPPRVAHPWTTTPASVLLDLALISAGAGSLPWPMERGMAPPADGVLWWLAAFGETPAPAGARPLPLAGPRGGVGRGADGPEDRLRDLLRVDETPTGRRKETPRQAPEASAEGGVVVARPVEGGAVLEDHPWAAVLQGARALETGLGAAGAQGREILVLADSPWEAARRRVFTWALARGAALVLEPRPESLVATAHWARPTIFAGTGRQVADLLGRVRPAEGESGWRRWARLGRPTRALGPLTGRLHTCLVLPSAGSSRDSELSPEELRDLAGNTALRILHIEARCNIEPEKEINGGAHD